MTRAARSLLAVVLLLAPVAAQNGNSPWTTWARANHYPVAQIQSVDGDTFADLQFFKTVLRDRRIVQLGESGHGVAEFNHAKVRLIKFLYTIGLYMDRGTAAQNDRVVYSINPGPVNSMEWVMANSGSPTLFMDFLHQSRGDGNSWMFQSTLQREWGVNSFSMIPRHQYDGVLFIDTVKAPSYYVGQ